MQWLFIAVVICGAGYFVSVKRRLDAFTVAYFSSVVYFLPGMVGYTLSPSSSRSPVRLPIALESEAIAIMIAVTVLIVLGAMLWDGLDKKSQPLGWVLEDSRLATWFALALGVIGVVMTVVESGGVAFTAGKTEVLEVIGRSHHLWEMGATVGAVLAFERGQRIAGLLCWFLLGLDVWIGFRYAFATTLIAVALLWFSRPEPFRLGLLRARYWLGIAAGGLVVFLIKNLHSFIRSGDWEGIGKRLSNPLWYAKEILTSEPFTTQTVLTEIVRSDFRTGTDHLAAAGYNLILFSTELGRAVVDFNGLFQPALFPYVESGLANNIWAQMWSAGDWPLLFGFILVFLALLAGWSRLLRSADPAVRAYAAVAIAYWAFYIHRNELQVAIQSQKLLLLVLVPCVFVAIAMVTLIRQRRSLDGLKATALQGESV